MKSVIIIEDHPLMRNGIKFLLEQNRDFKVVGEAGSLSEAIKIISTIKFEFAIVDISLPDGNGLSLITQIQKYQPDAKSIVMTMHKETPYVEKAQSMGAAGFLIKDMAPEYLIQTLQRVGVGEKVFYSEDPSQQFESSPSDKTEELSEREKSVLTLLYKGKSLTEISETLQLSVKTVFTYRIRILKKLGYKSGEELREDLKKNNVNLIRLMS